jgi:2-polyprenyl-3-methyl-5-hydroxy-6-metoxy-1,4-benzoquinol methylase
MRFTGPYSEQVRLKYTADYYLNACGGEETLAFDAKCPLPLRLAQAFNMAAPKPHEQVLDLGCGRGEVAHEAARLGCKAVGVDYSSDAIEIAQRGAFGTPWEERCEFILARTDEDGLGIDQFDVIFALDVFEHLHRDELRGLLATVKKRLRPRGRFVFHTSPNRHYYSVAYRAVYELARATGKSRLPKNSRSSHENDMHIGELTRKEVEHLLTEAGLSFHTSVFGMERILHAVEQSGLGPNTRRRLASWACNPQLRNFTNSDISGIGAHDGRVLDSCFSLQPGSEISLDHPFFFHEGWYVPVAGPPVHRWTSPHFSVKAAADRNLRLRLFFLPYGDHTAKLNVTLPGAGSRTYVLGQDGESEISLDWPRTEYPVSAQFTTTPAMRVDGDPRLFGVCLSKVICETN